jgi:hypothetical protein
MSIYYDPSRNVYVDTESGALIPADENDTISNGGECKSAINGKDMLEGTIDSDHAFALSLSEMENELRDNRNPAPTSPHNESFFQRVLSRINTGEFMYRRTKSNNSINYVPPNETMPSDGNHDDWSLARALQAMEFEMQEDLNLGVSHSATETDFNNKELRASSCKTQLLTISTAVVLTQIGILIAIIQIYGYAPRPVNPLIGPDAQALINFGAKEAGLIVKRGEWWRCITAIFLHAGILHILSNGAIQV